MNSMQLIGLNVKWYRHKNNITQKDLANKTKFKTTYISNIENGKSNLTCKNIEHIANALSINPELLFNEKTAIKAKKLDSL